MGEQQEAVKFSLKISLELELLLNLWSDGNGIDLATSLQATRRAFSRTQLVNQVKSLVKLEVQLDTKALQRSGMPS